MPLDRLLVALLLMLAGSLAHAQVRGKSRGSSDCPAQPVQCQVSAPAFYWGRSDQTYLQSPIYVQGSVSVTCSKQKGYKVDVDAEVRGLPGRLHREVSREGETLTYALFLKSNYTLVWGDGSSGTVPITDSFKLNNNDQTLTRTYMLYGRLDGNQGGSPGRYIDAVVARLFYTPTCN